MAAHLAGSTRPAVCLFELFGRLVPSLLLLVIHRQKKVENKCVLWITEWTGSFLLVSGLCFIKTGCYCKIGAIRLPLKETIKQYFTFLLCHSCRERAACQALLVPKAYLEKYLFHFSMCDFTVSLSTRGYCAPICCRMGQSRNRWTRFSFSLSDKPWR